MDFLFLATIHHTSLLCSPQPLLPPCELPPSHSSPTVVPACPPASAALVMIPCFAAQPFCRGQITRASLSRLAEEPFSQISGQQVHLCRRQTELARLECGLNAKVTDRHFYDPWNPRLARAACSDPLATAPQRRPGGAWPGTRAGGASCAGGGRWSPCRCRGSRSTPCP